MALADSSLILQMQLALIGIVLVTGLFYLWRSLCRIEDKVSRVALKLSQCGGGGRDACPIPPFKQFKGEEMGDFRVKPMNLADADAHAQELMKEVFGEEPVIMAAVVTEETVEVPETVAPKIPETNVIVEEDPAPSEAETENTNPLSKNKLNKMTPEELKNLCVQRGLSGEGSKKVLVDRLLGITRD